MDQLKDEFRNILMMITSHTNPCIEIDFDALIILDPNSSNRSSSVTESSATDFRTARLEDEFYNILISHTNRAETDTPITPNSSTPWSCVTESSAGFLTARESTDEGYLEYDYEDEFSCSTSYRSINSIREIDLIPLEAIYDLRSIAERMITAGYLRECIQVFVSVRKPALAATFCQIWIDKFNIGDVQGLEWDVLEPKIQRWIKVAKICIQILLRREKWLYGQIFQGEGLGATDNDACFMEIFKVPVKQPFEFSEVVCINPQTPEKLFKKLHLFDALSDLFSDMDLLFQWNSLEPVRVQVVVILSSLFETARETILEFARVVLHDDSRIPVPGGRIHPFTRCVMNYIIFVSDYMKVLFGSNPLTGSQIYGDQTALDINFPELENQALHQLSIIRILQIQLEEKSNYYNHVSLSHIFLMNNIHYIVQKVKGSPMLCEMIGHDYLWKLKWKFREEMMSYERSTWITILCTLRDEGRHVSGRFSKLVLKKRFTTFNSMFEGVHWVQATWSVPNPQLREEIRTSISENLIPAYRSFLDRYRGHIESEKHPEKYVKYSVEDLEIAILDLFEGHTVPHHTRR